MFLKAVYLFSPLFETVLPFQSNKQKKETLLMNSKQNETRLEKSLSINIFEWRSQIVPPNGHYFCTFPTSIQNQLIYRKCKKRTESVIIAVAFNKFKTNNSVIPLH